MNKIIEWVKHHQVLTFFILTYAVGWPGLFLWYFLFPGNELVEVITAPLVLFIPALAAMLISGIAEPRPKSASSKPRWISFFIAWFVSAAILILYGWRVQELDLPVNVILNGILALFPAWILSSAYARTPGIQKHFSTLLKPRGPAVWYLVIFLIFPGLWVLAVGITRLFGGEAEFFLADLGFEGAAIFLLLEFLRGFLMTGGINEESGWRGFAIPRLQARYPVIVSAGIVWFFWALFHIPYDIGNGVSVDWMLQNRLIWTLVFSILMTWLYNRTNGSILAPALFHPAMNTFGNSFSFTTAGKIIFISLAVFVIIYDRMWEKLPDESLAVHQTDSTRSEGLPELMVFQN